MICWINSRKITLNVETHQKLVHTNCPSPILITLYLYYSHVQKLMKCLVTRPLMANLLSKLRFT